MHDLIYDHGCSNRIVIAAYAASVPGVLENGLPYAFLIGFVGAVASKVLDGPKMKKRCTDTMDVSSLPSRAASMAGIGHGST